MKHFKLYAVAISLVAGMLLASNAQAQNIAPLFNAAGSTGAFNAFGIAAQVSGLCGTNAWSLKSGGAGHDNRGDSSISDSTANLWIEWNNTPEPNRTVCAYLAVDSIIGQRLFFGSPQGSLNMPSSDTSTTSGNIVPLVTDCACTLPVNIYNDLQGQVFNAAPTDIRAEDAEFANTRALAPLNANLTGLGYGPGPVGTTIMDGFGAGKSSQIVQYNISGNDPITNMPVPSPTTQTDVGSQAMMIAVNTTDTGVGHLGNAAFNNVDEFVLAGVFSGVLSRTADLIPSSGLPTVPLNTLYREPTSGTYNVMEFEGVRNVETELGYNPASQEKGVNDLNPLNITLPDGATRKRVIGTGQMTSELGSNADTIGYAFWSFGNWAPYVTTTKYLAVNGIDPLNATYTGGTFPTCTAPCPGTVTFPHLIDGSYPIWNILRVVTKKPVPSGIAALISVAQAQVANIPDFVPSTSLLVFRSHFKQSSVNPKNGHKAPHVQAGGDVGGAVFTTQADLDNITDTNMELTGYKQ